jgi:diguanylate cyclase (GGDEF)-like protein
MLTRLMAVRSGGAAYFTKPLDIAEFIDSLDALTTQETPEPYRILIVDDDPQLSEFYSWALQGAGMQTQHVGDPMHVMEPLINFRPDLILMDVYMPGCSGLELATAIRQQRDYVGIPIVFLSAETDVEKQLSAMSLGGDDFLTKPILPDHLISAVASRAHRSRSLRSFMMRDSLTGLLNHTATKEQIDVELARARRNGDAVCVAMLDIDRFKSVNDTYGHLAGDRVIKNLARLLQQRLRSTDVIGRYGGEEFAVLLSGANGEASLRVLNDIRLGFAALKQQAGSTEFSATLSCGIATFPQHDTAAQLTDAADKALYEAKNSGRNKVVLSRSAHKS